MGALKMNMKARCRVEGVAGLIPRSRGWRSNKVKDEWFSEEGAGAIRRAVSGFWATLAGEYLDKEHLPVDHETLSRSLLETGH